MLKLWSFILGLRYSNSVPSRTRLPKSMPGTGPSFGASKDASYPRVFGSLLEVAASNFYKQAEESVNAQKHPKADCGQDCSYSIMIYCTLLFVEADSKADFRHL
jgi:hypothetical protein